jgi:hypothetical protein
MPCRRYSSPWLRSDSLVTITVTDFVGIRSRILTAIGFIRELTRTPRTSSIFQIYTTNVCYVVSVKWHAPVVATVLKTIADQQCHFSIDIIFCLRLEKQSRQNLHGADTLLSEYWQNDKNYQIARPDQDPHDEVKRDLREVDLTN